MLGVGASTGAVRATVRGVFVEMTGEEYGFPDGINYLLLKEIMERAF